MNKPSAQCFDDSLKAEFDKVVYRDCVSYQYFFKGVLDGTIKLSPTKEADVFASWKVDGEDFYIYGKKKETKNAK